jgi:Glycosyl hydrolase catalytic core
MTPKAPFAPISAPLAPFAPVKATTPTLAPLKATPTLAPVLASPTATTAAPTNKLVCPVFPPPPPLLGKKGIGFTLPNEGAENMPKVIRLRPYWNYSWGPKQVAAQPLDIEFVPMIWGGNTAALVQKSLTDFIYPQVASGQSKRLLGFNEPDNVQESNVPVNRALDRWPLLESANVSLVSPACVQPDGPWLKGFIKNATETCKRVDWIGIHWYGLPNVAQFKSKLTATYQLYGGSRPLLITEFALANFTATTLADNKISRASVLAFMKQVLPWLEAQPWIVGYAWFPFSIAQPVGTSSALFNELGELTAAGRFYASVRTETPFGNQSIVPDR